MLVITVDVTANRLEARGRAAHGTRRWEALALACLVEAGGLGVSAAVLQLVLQRAGQMALLDRTGLLRVFRGMQDMVDAVLGPGAMAMRLRFAPRHRTVGPWSFVPGEGEQWQVVGHASAAGRAMPGGTGAGPAVQAMDDMCGMAQPMPALVDDPDPCAIFRPLELIFRADAFATSGQLREAADLLLAASKVKRLTREGLGVVELRRARVLKRCGRYEEALDLTVQVARQAGQRGFPDPGQKCLAVQLARRIRYDLAPQCHESLGADPYFSTSTLLPDTRGLGEAENLAALIARRRSFGAGTPPAPDEARRLLATASQHLHAALYWATSMRDHENAENFVFNMGLVQASRNDLGEADAVVAAFGAYQIGLLIRDNFFVGKDSVWDEICMGNLWLDHPQRRREFESVLGLEHARLSEAGFFKQALEQARRIGEPRQMALCCINLWRFGSEGGATGGPSANLRRLAREQLLGLLRGRLDLRETLMRDAPATMAKMLAA